MRQELSEYHVVVPHDGSTAVLGLRHFKVGGTKFPDITYDVQYSVYICTRAFNSSPPLSIVISCISGKHKLGRAGESRAQSRSTFYHPPFQHHCSSTGFIFQYSLCMALEKLCHCYLDHVHVHSEPLKFTVHCTRP